MTWLTSKTVWGALLAILAWLASPEVTATMPKLTAAIVQAVGMLISVIGARQAIGKAAEGKSR